MLKLIWTVLLITSLTGCASGITAQTDRNAIHGVLDDWNRGWEQGDSALATQGYADDADFTNAFGSHQVGRDDIAEFIAEVFTFDFVMAGSSVDDAVDIRFIDEDVALVRTRRTRTGQQAPDGRL